MTDHGDQARAADSVGDAQAAAIAAVYAAWSTSWTDARSAFWAAYVERVAVRSACIANPANHDDQWLVAAAYFAAISSR
jgi:hypothetical protein